MTPERISRLLPEVWHAPHSAAAARDGSEHARLLWDVLCAMSALHKPAEETLGTLPDLVDPIAAQDRFVPMLAGWLDLDGYLSWPSGRINLGSPHLATGSDRLRALCTLAPGLRRRRGLADALRGFLETALGVSGVRIEENAAGSRFHIRVHLPDRARAYEELARSIIHEERPAHCTWDLRFEEAREAAGDRDLGEVPGEDEEIAGEPRTGKEPEDG